MSNYNFQREILSAIYYREANKAVENSDAVIESEFNQYFERQWIFKKFPKFGKSCSGLRSPSEIFYFKYMMSGTSISFAAICIIFSLVLFVAEITIFIEQTLFEKLIEYLTNATSKHGFIITFSVTLMSYMALICYFGVFYLKIFGFYGFWKKQTLAITMLYSALYASKLTFPMIFNFMLMFFKAKSQNMDFI